MAHASFRISSVILVFGLISGCDSQGDPGEAVNQETVYSGPERHTISVGKDYYFSESLTDPNGLVATRISVVVDGGPTAAISEQSDYSVQVEFHYTPTTVDDDVTVKITGVDEDGFALTPRTILLDAEDITDARASVINATSARGIAGRKTTIRAYAEDPDGLVNGFVQVAGQRFEESFGSTSGELKVPVLLPASGLSYVGGFQDVYGNTTRFAGFVDAIGRASLRVLFRSFLSKESGAGSLDLTLQEPGVVWDTTLVADGSGWAEWNVPVGRYEVILHGPAEASPLVRLLMKPEMLNDPEALWAFAASYADESGALQSDQTVTYGITDRQAVPFYMDILSDLTTVAEYLRDASFLEKMSRQVADDELVLYGARDAITFVVYDGPCNAQWNYAIYGCGNGSPPGAAAAPSSLENHRAWYEHIIRLISGRVVGGNPFTVTRQVVNASQIGPILQQWNDTDVTPRRGYSVARFSNTDGKGYGWNKYRPDNGPWFVTRSQSTIRGDIVSDFAHVGNVVFGQSSITKQGTEQVCSVLDPRPDEALNCPPGLPAVQREFDDKFVQIAVAYGSWAQYQMTSNGRGINVKLR